MTTTAKIDLTKKDEMISFLTSLFAPHAVALQGIMDKVPESLRPDFKKLKDDLDEALSKLKPTDQVPMALDANYALQSLCGALERFQEISTSFTSRIADLVRSINEKATSLQGYLDKEKSGELITKAAATELVNKAKEDAVAAFKPTIVAMRKSQVELAGLPMPGDDVLGLEEKDFTPRFDAAKANVTDLNKRGLKNGGRGSSLVKDLAWLPASEYAGKVSSYEDILGKPSAADPLLGGPGSAETPPKAGAADKVRSKAW